MGNMDSYRKLKIAQILTGVGSVGTAVSTVIAGASSYKNWNNSKNAFNEAKELLIDAAKNKTAYEVTENTNIDDILQLGKIYRVLDDEIDDYKAAERKMSVDESDYYLSVAGGLTISGGLAATSYGCAEEKRRLQEELCNKNL